MFNLVVNLFVLVALCYMFYTKTDWKKPIGWLVPNVVWLLAGLVLFMVNIHWYLLAGLVFSALDAVYDHFVVGLPFSFWSFLSNAIDNVFFFPTNVFERVYGWLKAKV